VVKSAYKGMLSWKGRYTAVCDVKPETLL